MNGMKLVTVVLAALTLAACQKADRTGRLTFCIEEGQVADVETKGNVSDYAAMPSAENFVLTLRNGSSTIWSGMLSEWDSTKELKAGNYTAEASFGSADEEGYAKPYFFGTSSFSINGGGSTAVGIPVSLGNTIVKISCTDAFKNYYTSYSFTVTTGAGNVFEYREGGIFMDAYKFSVSGTLTAQNGSSYTMAARTWNVEPATCYNVKFDVSNIGSVTVSISFDDAVRTVELTEDLNA